MDLAQLHPLIHGLAHIVDGQQRGGNTGQGLHLNAGDAAGLDGAAGLHRPALRQQFELDLHLGQRQRMAQRDQLAGALGGHDASHAGYAQHIAFLHRAVLHGGKGVFVHGNDAVGRGLAGGDRLAAHVHHHRIALGIEMGQFIFCCIHKIHVILRVAFHNGAGSAVPEPAVGPGAGAAAQAEAALPQAGDILGGDGVIGQQTGQQQIENGPLGVHHAARQAADRHTVQIADQEHGTGQHRRTVGNNFSSGVPDGQRGAVVRIHAHAAGGKDQLTACGLCFQNGGRDARRVIVADLVEGHLTAIHRQLLLEDGSKLVLNAALEHLAAGGDNGKLLLVEGQHVQDGLRPGSSLHGLHLLLLNDQRDDAGTSQLGSLFHRQIAVDRGDHHLGGAVHRQQGPAVDLEQTVAVGDQFDLALPG